MANKVYMTVRDCRECVRNKPSEKKQRPLQLFMARGALEFIVIDILAPLPKTLNKIQFVLVIKDFYWKLMKSMMTSKTTVYHVS